MGMFFDDVVKSEYCLDLILEHSEEIIEESGIGGIFTRIIKLIDIFIKKIEDKLQNVIMKNMIKRAMKYADDHPFESVKFVDFKMFDHYLRGYINAFSNSLIVIQNKINSPNYSSIINNLKKNSNIYDKKIRSSMNNKVTMTYQEFDSTIDKIILCGDYAPKILSLIRSDVIKANDKLSTINIKNADSLKKTLSYIDEVYSNIQRFLDYIITVSITTVNTVYGDAF